MNTDVLEGKWKQLRGQVKEWWGQLTDDDLDRVAGKSDRLVGLLQERYGYSKDKAQAEFDRRMEEFGDFEDTWGFMSGIILGVLAGAAIMLLLAPQSGEKTRRKLRQKGMEIRDQAMHTAEDIQHRAEDTMSQARQRIPTRG